MCAFLKIRAEGSNVIFFFKSCWFGGKIADFVGCNVPFFSVFRFYYGILKLIKLKLSCIHYSPKIAMAQNDFVPYELEIKNHNADMEIQRKCVMCSTIFMCATHKSMTWTHIYVLFKCYRYSFY